VSEKDDGIDDTTEAEEEDEEEEPPKTPGQWVFEIIKTWGPAVLAIIIIRTFIFQPFSIPSPSMVPTLLIGDHVVVTKFNYGIWFPDPLSFKRWELLDIADPERGDVIVFRFPQNKAIHYIKRVVAIPGDTIQVKDNQIFINGESYERTRNGDYTYLGESCKPSTLKLWDEKIGTMSHAKLTDYAGPSPLAYHEPIKVPEGKIFAMGDNRDHSGDSRQWGYVDEELIMGKAHFVWLSFNKCGDWANPLRWDRIGQSLYTTVEPTSPAQDK
jgi:signal peptidase I